MSAWSTSPSRGSRAKVAMPANRGTTLASTGPIGSSAGGFSGCILENLRSSPVNLGVRLCPRVRRVNGIRTGGRGRGASARHGRGGSDVSGRLRVGLVRGLAGQAGDAGAGVALARRDGPQRPLRHGERDASGGDGGPPW